MASKTPAKAAANTTLAVSDSILDKFKNIVAYEPHPLRDGEFQMNKPYVKLPFVIMAEGMEDLEQDEIPFSFPEVKLLHGQSQPIADELPGAKPGRFWHAGNVEALPDDLTIVALLMYSVKYPPSDLNPEGSDVKFVVFTPLEFLQTYNEWIGRALDPDDLDLGREIISNTFVIGFQSTGLQEHKKLQSTALNQGALYAIAFKLGTRDRQNAKGKWKNATLTPAARLNDNEKIAARSLKELVREAHSRMEAYYAKRRESFAEAYPQDEQGGADVSDV